MTTIHADILQTNVPIDVLITRDGGITGLTVVLRILNGDNLDESLDFPAGGGDGTFKAAGHTDPTLPLPAIDAANDPGLYGLTGGFDFSSITIPAGVNTLRAHYTVTAGGETGDAYDLIVLDDKLVDLIWDEVNRGADHNIQNSTGKQQRQATGGAESEDVVSATATTIELQNSESAINGFLNFREIAIVAGVGAGQSRVIESYVGATRIATLDRPWDTTPIAGDDYLLLLGKRTFPDPQEVRDAAKLAPTAGAPAGGSVDEHLDDILADTNEIQGKLPTNFIMGSGVVTDKDDEIDAILLDTGTTIPGTITTLQADTDDIQARLPAALVGGRMDSDVAIIQTGVITAAVIATDAIDADALAADAVTEIQSSILSDATQFPGASITEARLAELDPANLPSDIDAILLDTGTTLPAQISALNDITAGEVWDELVASHVVASSFGLLIGTNLDALISSRSSHSAADVDTVLTASHSAGSWNGTTPAAIWSEVVPGAFGAGSAGFILGTNLDVILSTRSSHTAANVDAVLSGTHGGGSWLSATGFATPANVTAVITQGDLAWTTATGFAVAGDAMTLTAAAVDLIWDELQAGHVTPGTFGLFLDAPISTAGSPAAIAAAVWAEALPAAFGGGTAGFIVGTNLDALVSSRSAHSAADVDTVLSGTHGGGSWLGATGFAVPGDAMTLTAAGVDLIWDELQAGHVTPGTFGLFLDAPVSTAGSPAAIATAVWSEALPGAFGAGSSGFILGTNLDVLVSSRSDFNEATDPVELLDAGGAAGTSAAELVVDIWDNDVSTDANQDLAGGAINLLRKGLTNRLELTAGNPGFLRLYDDNSTTLLLTWEERNAIGVGFLISSNSPARRTKAT